MRIQKLIEPIQIRRAVLGFSGWPDAGELIEYSLSELQQLTTCRPAAVWDLDGFWHKEMFRPQVRIQHGHLRKMTWPSYHFMVGDTATAEAFLLGAGPEPGSRWRAFASRLLQQLKQWGCEELILLGSLHDQVFHDEIVISGVAQDSKGLNRIRELGCQRIEYEGPGAVHSALMEAAQGLDISALSIWAHLPFYLNGPHELIMAHLLRLLAQLLGIQLDTRHLMQDWEKRQQQIEDRIQQDHELRQVLESISRDKPAARSAPDSSKVVRLDEFLKKRHGPEPDEE